MGWRIVWAVVACLPALAQAEKPLNSVADLRYGVVLYDYFQGDYFEALSELMVAKEQGGIQGHKDNPELIEGGINLAFGMDRRAGDIFARLLDDDKPHDIKNAAWYYLSKLRYQRGQYELAQESLSQVQGEIEPRLAESMTALKIQLLIKNKRLVEADEQLLDAPTSPRKKNQFLFSLPYINFNLGTAYAKQGNFPAAQTHFSQVVDSKLSRDDAFREEQLALYDKSYTAAGFSYFLEKNYAEAIEQFSHVRQQSHFSNDALLGYGWSAAKMENYELALTPWLVLSQRSLVNDAVQESLLAIPYAYSQLEDMPQALARYSFAEKTYLAEIDRITNVAAELSNQSMIELLALDQSDINYNWLLPEKTTAVKPHLRYLLDLFSLNHFQNTVQTVRDLHRIRRKLEAWQSSLEAYDDLLAYRLNTFRLQDEPVEYRNMSAELSSLQVERDNFAEQLREAREQNNVLLLLDEDRQDLLAMVEDGEENLRQLRAAGENVEEEGQWMQRYRGMLLWSATMDFDDRLWRGETQLKQINAALGEAAKTDTNVQRLFTQAPDIRAAQERIARYSQRLDQQLEQNNIVLARVEQKLRDQVLKELARQRQRIQFYLAEARLSIAKLYDQQLLDKEAE